MSFSDLLLQQTINGLSLGGMYALLALGFTLIYGILELINFAHFNVFMVGSFVGMWTLQAFGLYRSGRDPDRIASGRGPAGCVHRNDGLFWSARDDDRAIVPPAVTERNGPAAMITTIGVSYILFNIVLLTVGANSKNFPNPLPPVNFNIHGAVIELREILIWVVSVVLMAAL